MTCVECSIATSCDQATLHDGRLSVAKMRQDAESDSLKRLFSSVTNRAAFARQHKLRSDPSLIGQHMSGHRPISLEAGIEYAKAFGVSLEEISQRLAALVRQATAVMSAPPDGPSAPGRSTLSRPTAGTGSPRGKREWSSRLRSKRSSASRRH